MKEKTACIIGVIFSVALVVFTAMKLVPVEVFIALAGAAVAWFYRTIEDIRARRRAK